jgi:short-subunit dehydrogenase involved in D-alanine esterification of teichoic acids
MAPLVYLISGANRGIGKDPVTETGIKVHHSRFPPTGLELVKSLLAREDAVVFAGARDPSKAVDLLSLAKDNANKLHIVQLISADEVNNKGVAEQIKASVGRLDVVVANAGE